MAFYGVGNPFFVVSEGEQTNPADETVMADTGELRAGHYFGYVVASADAIAQFRLERRNAANDAAVGDSILIYVPADDMRQAVFGFTVDTSERIRVVMDDALTGGAAASINYTKQM